MASAADIRANRKHTMDFVLGPFTRDMVESYTQGTVAIIPALLSILQLPLDLKTGHDVDPTKFYTMIDTLHLLMDKEDFGIYTTTLSDVFAEKFKQLQDVITTTINSQLNLDKSQHTITVRTITDLHDTACAHLPAATTIQLHPYITMTSADMATVLQGVISDSLQYLSNNKKSGVKHIYMPTLAVRFLADLDWYFFFLYVLYLFCMFIDRIPIVRYMILWLYTPKSGIPMFIFPHSIVYTRIVDEQLEMLKRYWPISLNNAKAEAALKSALEKKVYSIENLLSIFPTATTTESELLNLKSKPPGFDSPKWYITPSYLFVSALKPTLSIPIIWTVFMSTLSTIMAQSTIHINTLFAYLPLKVVITPKTQLVIHFFTMISSYGIIFVLVWMLLRYHTTTSIYRGAGVPYRGLIKLLYFPMASFVFIVHYLCAYTMYKLF